MEHEFENSNPTSEEAVNAAISEPAEEIVPEIAAEEIVPQPVEETTYRYKPEPAPEYIASAPVPEQPAQPKKRKKKKGNGKKIVALALCCVLLGGLCGAGGTLLTLHLLENKTGTTITNIAGVLMGQRENSVIDIEKIDTSKLLTAAEVYAANVNSTVSILASGTAGNGGYWGSSQKVASAGSGFILSLDGYVLTNYHVVEGMDTIKVKLYDKRELSAVLIGYDESNDIAVLKVEGKNLTPAVLGDSDNLNVGDGVVAIGNPLGELSFTLTAGYISAKDRVITMSSGATMTLLQTDCPINSGNSGGALFNMYGEVIGITNAKYSNNGNSTEASIDNIGFAIPMNRVKEIVFDIIEEGAVTKPYVGITVMSVTAQMQSWGVPNGAWVTEIANGSPAAQGGLRVDDIITHFNGEVVESHSALVAMAGNCKPGQSVTLTVYRGGKTLELTIVIGEKIQPATRK